MKGEQIKDKLQSTGMSMASIARKVGITPQALQAIFNAQNVSTEKMEMICKGMGWSVGYLYDEQPHFL